MSYIRWFEEIAAGEVDTVGGKGANLGEMAAAGLPVPPGFCLTTSAYRQFIGATGLERVIGDILVATDIDDPVDVEAASARIRHLLHDQPVPPIIARQAVEAYQRLGRMMGEADPTRTPVAVRSSATAEDLPEASFAGQQETYLNVVGEAALLERIKGCWASLWTARAVTYRARQDLDHQGVYLAVVVQAMVPSEVSGVLFTANPVSGNRDEAVLNASWGLGEAVVSGLVTPDTYVIRKRGGQVVSQEIGGKEITITRAEDGGTLEGETPAARRSIPALSAEQVLELVAMGQKIEAHYGAPQDIEWAYARGRCFVLQARPITTIATPVEVPERANEYNRSMFVEIFPDPLSPLFLSVICPLFKEMLDFTFKTCGFTPPQGLEATGAFYNQPYFNQTYIAAALAPLSPSVRERLVAQLVNPFGRHEGAMRGEPSPAYLGMIARMLRFMVRFPSQLPGVIARYREEIAEVAALPTGEIPDGEIVARVRALVFGAASRFLNYDFLMIALIGITYQILGTLLERYFGEDTQLLRAKLISGVTGNVTMETNTQLWDLAQIAKSSPAVGDALREGADGGVRDRLERDSGGQAFLEALDRFLDEYGHREIRMDILYPTWGEDPTPVFGFIRGYLDAEESQSPHRQQARLVKERQEVTEEVLAHVERSQAGRLLVSPLFRWILVQTQAHTRERDTMHFELTRLFPPFRGLLLELGRRWRKGGLIAEPEDVFFLTIDELDELADAPRPVQEVVAARRGEFEANKTRPWPKVIRGGEEVYAEAPEVGEALEGGLRGIAGSPGLVTGAAKVIRGPEEFSKLKRGDILVAPLTNPVWTPLFAIAGGVVTEVGGILSHGAIVAREYGIPAVMSVAGATAQIPEGQRVTVDGNKGTVHLETGAAGC